MSIHSFPNRRTGSPAANLAPHAPTGGEPPYDAGMEARVAKLEAGVEHLERDVSDIKVELRALRADQRTDFRTTWIGLIAVALGLAGLIAKGFHWL